RNSSVQQPWTTIVTHHESDRNHHHNTDKTPLCLLIHTLISPKTTPIPRCLRATAKFKPPEVQRLCAKARCPSCVVNCLCRLTGSVCGKIIWAPPFCL